LFLRRGFYFIVDQRIQIIKQAEDLNHSNKATIDITRKIAQLGREHDALQDEPMAVRAERFCNGDHAPDDAPWYYEVDHRSGRGRGKHRTDRRGDPLTPNSGCRIADDTYSSRFIPEGVAETSQIH
jgi:hypothetical protein